MVYKRYILLYYVFITSNSSFVLICIKSHMGVYGNRKLYKLETNYVKK